MIALVEAYDGFVMNLLQLLIAVCYHMDLFSRGFSSCFLGPNHSFISNAYGIDPWYQPPYFQFVLDFRYCFGWFHILEIKP